ncbi:hypothetical protein BGX27_004973 [Mortierella sp. AM989]|nr:hypothetical protein BGX27_004973 [Mortierella sp. AM989]
MSTKQHNSSSFKKNKQTSNQDVSKGSFSSEIEQKDPSLLSSSPSLDPSSSRKYIDATDSNLESLSTAMFLGTSSSTTSSLHYRKQTFIQENLESLDQDEDTDHTRRTNTDSRSDIQQKCLTKKDVQHVSPVKNAYSGWILTAPERHEPGLWAWLTSSRVVSDEQRWLEEMEERINWAKHERKVRKLLGDTSRRDDCDFDDSGIGSRCELRSSHLKDKVNSKTKSDEFMDVANNLVSSAPISMTSHDWVALSVLTVTTLGVRFWRISWPDEVVLDESHIGRLINAYVKNEYALDAHPPLGKLILAGISSLSNYDGSVDFDEIGEYALFALRISLPCHICCSDDPRINLLFTNDVSLYPSSVPYISMRATLALMGSFCAPMAYITLRASNQGATASILAAVLIAFDNALTTNNRLMALDAPFMFFTAATTMSWALFMKHSNSPFTAQWWAWLVLAGISIAGAASTKLAGILGAVSVILFAIRDLWTLGLRDTISIAQWGKHYAARALALVVLPLVIYLSLFQIHFSHQLHQPDFRNSVQAEIDLYRSHPSVRHSLLPKYSDGDHHFRYQNDYNNGSSRVTAKVWRDVAFGSVVQLRSEYDTGVYLHSYFRSNPTGSKQQQVSGYEYPDLNTRWIVVRAVMSSDHDKKEIPSRLQYLKNGDILRLRHISTRRCLHSHSVRTLIGHNYKYLNEVSAYGGSGSDGEKNDRWIVEMVDTEPNLGFMTRKIDSGKTSKDCVRALESTFRLKHQKRDCYLYVSDTYLPRSWGEGRKEVVCGKFAKMTTKSIWRFTSNENDNLPADASLASFPRLSFGTKLIHTHQQMWSSNNKGHGDSIASRDTYNRASSKPLSWPLARSLIPAWTGYKRQMAIVGNPVVWWTGTLGILIFVVAKVAFILREKRECFETGRLGADDQGVSPLFMHHYFPALYFSILLTCSLFSGLVGFLPRKIRFGFYTGLIAIILMVFSQLAPLTYGGPLTREHCKFLNKRINSFTGQRGDSLDCSLAPQQSARPVLLSVLRERKRKDSALTTQQQQAKFYSASAPELQPGNARGSSSPTITPIAQPRILSDAPKGRLPISKPKPMKRAPIIDISLPHENEVLPNQDAGLLHYQSPPQHWDAKTRVMMLRRYRKNPYQRQQIQQLIRENRQESDVNDATLEMMEEEDENVSSEFDHTK